MGPPLQGASASARMFGVFKQNRVFIFWHAFAAAHAALRRQPSSQPESAEPTVPYSSPPSTTSPEPNVRARRRAQTLGVDQPADRAGQPAKQQGAARAAAGQPGGGAPQPNNEKRGSTHTPRAGGRARPPPTGGQQQKQGHDDVASSSVGGRRLQPPRPASGRPRVEHDPSRGIGSSLSRPPPLIRYRSYSDCLPPPPPPKRDEAHTSPSHGMLGFLWHA